MLFSQCEVLTLFDNGIISSIFPQSSSYETGIFLSIDEMLCIRTTWSSRLMWQWILVKIYESLPRNIEIKSKEEKRCERTKSLCDRDDYCTFVRQSRATVAFVQRREVVLVRQQEVRLQ